MGGWPSGLGGSGVLRSGWHSLDGNGFEGRGKTHKCASDQQLVDSISRFSHEQLV